MPPIDTAWPNAPLAIRNRAPTTPPVSQLARIYPNTSAHARQAFMAISATNA